MHWLVLSELCSVCNEHNINIQFVLCFGIGAASSPSLKMAEWNLSHPFEGEIFNLFNLLIQQKLGEHVDDCDFSGDDDDRRHHHHHYMSERLYEPELCQSTGLLS